MEHLNPVIVINEKDGEALYAIVDFQEPGSRYVRRIIAKQVAGGNIFAAMYVGTVGVDGCCTDKRDLMRMDDMPREGFWKMVRLLEGLYKIRGGTTKVQGYSGKTLREATDIMRKLGTAKVWHAEDSPHNL